MRELRDSNEQRRLPCPRRARSLRGRWHIQRPGTSCAGRGAPVAARYPARTCALSAEKASMRFPLHVAFSLAWVCCRSPQRMRRPAARASRRCARRGERRNRAARSACTAKRRIRATTRVAPRIARALALRAQTDGPDARSRGCCAPAPQAAIDSSDLGARAARAQALSHACRRAVLTGSVPGSSRWTISSGHARAVLPPARLRAAAAPRGFIDRELAQRPRWDRATR